MMRSRIWVLAPLLALAVATVLAQVLAAPGQRALVLSIGDGDTLRVRRGGRTLTVRLACIDAPEHTQSPWGQQARLHLQQRLPIGREVTLDVKAHDRYGRLVAEVISDSNIGLGMVADGQAFAYRRYLANCNARAYLDAEDRASRRRRGVWQQEGGITRPWAYRRR
jgi:endonuclease YncB( thermonuclease family)